MLIFIATALIVSESFLSSLSSVRSANTENFNEKARYVVDGVPYTQKVKGLSCDYGPLEMVFRYYGINISKYEIFLLFWWRLLYGVWNSSKKIL